MGRSERRPERTRARRLAVLVLAVIALLAAACQSRPPYIVEGCTPADAEGRSVARVWNETILELILAAFTGTPFFPGGLDEWTMPAGGLRHEKGPTTDVTLQWATYYDAADQAGLSRLFMGIHIPEDDVVGRRVGAVCGTAAWELARRYYDGSARG